MAGSFFKRPEGQAGSCRGMIGLSMRAEIRLTQEKDRRICFSLRCQMHIGVHIYVNKHPHSVNIYVHMTPYTRSSAFELRA